MWRRGFLAETEGNPRARALPKPLTVDHITPVYGPWAKATLPSPDVGKWEQWQAHINNHLLMGRMVVTLQRGI